MLRTTATMLVLGTFVFTGCGQSEDGPWSNGLGGKGDDYWGKGELGSLDKSPQLKDVRATVLTRNEDALAAKLRVIDNAQTGETLDLVYFIFSDDESSAFVASRLIEAAQRGVKVRVLLDYFTNWSRWYYYSLIRFAAMDGNVSGGSLDFAFYNKPSPGIIEDAHFMVTPCAIPNESITSGACTENRKANMYSDESKRKAKWFLTGLYGKSQTAMMAALADVMPQFEAVQNQGGEDVSDDDKAAMMKGLKLIFNAEIKGDFGAKLALFFFASQLRPLTDAAASVNLFGLKENSQDWEHLTDYIHQKLTLRTGIADSEVVLGGRNVENSYHLSEFPTQPGTYRAYGDTEDRTSWDAKYSFMDVDLYARFVGTDIRDRYEKIWNFSDMVAGMFYDSGPVWDLEIDGQKALPQYGYDYIDLAVKRFDEYYTYTHVMGTVKPTELNPAPAYKLGGDGQLPVFEGVSAEAFYYVENIPNEPQEIPWTYCNERENEPLGCSNTRVDYEDPARIFGTGGLWENEIKAGKNIHALWLEQLAATCKNKSDPKEVVFHNAYLLLPTRLQRALLEAVSPGRCPGVSKFTIITNSRESTDLNVINVFNESYIKPLLESADGRLEYYEYTTDKVSSVNLLKRSLHAKVMIFGDNIFIGSANADGRSKFMDANNGMFLKNATDFVDKYKSWLNTQIIGQVAFPDPHRIASTDHESLVTSNLDYFFAQRWFESLDSDQVGSIRTSFQQTCEQLYDVTSKVMPNELSGKTSIKSGGKDLEPKNNEEIMVMTDRQVQLL